MPLESSVLSKISIMNSLVISEKQNFFLLDDKILHDADCADMSRYDNTELARTNQNQFCTLGIFIYRLT